MKPWHKAFIAGYSIEVILFSIMGMSESGPCGPASPAAGVLRIIHLPALYACTPFSLLGLPEWTNFGFIYLLAGAFWSLLILMWMRCIRI